MNDVRIFIVMADGELQKACIVPEELAATAHDQLRAARDAQWAGGTQVVLNVVPDSLADVIAFLKDDDPK